MTNKEKLVKRFTYQKSICQNDFGKKFRFSIHFFTDVFWMDLNPFTKDWIRLKLEIKKI